MRLLLIRHGQTPSNVARLLDTGAPGPGLTELGSEQAAALPPALAGEEIGQLFASNLVRTQLTAAPLAAERGLDVQIRPGIREIGAGEWDMSGDIDAHHAYMRTIFGWSEGSTSVRIPGGDTGDEVLGRFDEVVAEAAASGQPAALVSHGAVIRTWTAARAANVDVPYAAAHPIANTGIVILTGTPATGWHAEAWEGQPVAGTADKAPLHQP
ncbi:histidine phosphatase family protein [Nocardiopsis coralliicola]